MTSLAERTITALRAEHEATAGAVRDLTEDQLTGPSGATEWTLADALSHLGSAAVITLAGLHAALGTGPVPGDGFNQSVWDVWNAMAPAQQRDGYLEKDSELVAAFEALDEQQRESLHLHVGFAPAPLPVAAFAGLRLNEAAQHSWDVRVAGEPAAGLVPGSAEVLLELFSGDLAFLLGFIGKPDRISVPVQLDIAGSGYGLSITDSVAVLRSIGQPTAAFTGPLEAVVRLVAGRLGPAHTPPDVTVTGNVTLDELRTVFPGF